MTRTSHNRRSERGTTLIEVIVAATVMLLAMVVFLLVAVAAINSNRLAHRTTSLAMLRSGVIDALAVTPRSSLQAGGGWLLDRCWDSSSGLVGANTVPPSSTFTCPASAAYRSWRNITFNGTASWSVGIYVERVDGGVAGCDATTRYQSAACTAADLLLTD